MKVIFEIKDIFEAEDILSHIDVASQVFFEKGNKNLEAEALALKAKLQGQLDKQKEQAQIAWDSQRES